MKQLKKLIATAVFVALTATTTQVQASGCVTDCGGYGYQECCSSPKLAPTIALGTIAVVAIVAVAVQTSRGGSSSHSGHSHAF